jgi:hypothetical protein
LRLAARIGLTAHVDQCLDPVAFQKLEELSDRMTGMANGQDHFDG